MEKITLLFIAMFMLVNADTTFVVDVDNTLAPELYKRSIEWIAKTYNNKNEVLQLDSETKVIIKGGISTTASKIITGFGKGFVNYTISLSFKDNKYRIEIDQFYHKTTNYSLAYDGDIGNIYNPREYFTKYKMNRKEVSNVIRQVESEIETIVYSLKGAMSTQAKNVDDNW